MRTFTMIRPGIWTSPLFNRLSDRARLLLLYYTSGPHQTSAGISHVPDGYTAADLGWALADCGEARTELCREHAIRFDNVTFEVLIEAWWRDNFPTNPSHIKGVEKVLDSVRSDELREAARSSLEEERRHRKSAIVRLASGQNEVLTSPSAAVLASKLGSRGRA